jgi:uncharacterized protein (TIGR02611 family)
MKSDTQEPKQRKSVSDRLYGNYMGRRDSARTNRVLDTTWRAIILVVGLTLLGLGLFFLLFPGPGWAVIIVGLIVLATEYAWAQRLLNPVKEFSSRIARLVVSDEYRIRRSNVVLIITFAIVTIAYAYWARWGATMQGFEPILVPIENLFNTEI